jgi:hypothetical protein
VCQGQVVHSGAYKQISKYTRLYLWPCGSQFLLTVKRDEEQEDQEQDHEQDEHDEDEDGGGEDQDDEVDEDYQDDDDDDDDEGGTKGVKKNVKKVKQVKKVKKVKKGIATKVEGKGKRKEDTEMVDGAKVKGKGKVDQHYRTEDRHREHSKVYHQTFKKSLAQGMSLEEARADARLAASLHVRIMFG